MTCFTIDAGTFARTALAVLNQGKMAFQDPELRRSGSCSYSYANGCRCVIGAGLSPETAKALDHGPTGTVGELLGDGRLVVTSDYIEEPHLLRVTLIELQLAHDSVMNGMAGDEQIARVRATLIEELCLLADLHPAPEEPD